MALVHSRFSTNTFPSWNRAQPMRMLGHNGVFLWFCVCVCGICSLNCLLAIAFWCVRASMV